MIHNAFNKKNTLRRQHQQKGAPLHFCIFALLLQCDCKLKQGVELPRIVGTYDTGSEQCCKQDDAQRRKAYAHLLFPIF